MIRSLFPHLRLALVLTLTLACLPALGYAQDAVPEPTANAGDTAWMLVSSLLVLMMTIPGLALFYGGMVHRSSVLAALAQSFAITCLVSVLWVVYGYSFAFTGDTSVANYIGDASKVMMAGIGLKTLSGTIPESVFVMFQGTFAIITCALMVGAVATRIKFGSMLAFVTAWLTFVYVPVCHWVWGPGGFVGGTGMTDYAGPGGLGATLDFAGGTVVHINAGIAGLVAALMIRRGFDFDKRRKNTPPYNVGLSLVGASLLWVGWFGFNAGSAVASGERAGMAMLVTHVATATAGLAWILVEWLTVKKPTVLGMISGAVAGLVAITPASGFVDVGGALWIGAAAGFFCFYGAQLKYKLGYDDTLDVFGIHGVGGIVGAVLTGVFASSAIGGAAGALEGNTAQITAQFAGIGITIAYCAIVSYIILKLIDVTMGLRVADADEHELDMSLHGEKIH